MPHSNAEKVGTIYEAIGGQRAVDHIVDSMYKHVAQHEALIPIFHEDLTETGRTIYEAIGGQSAVYHIVDAMYKHVAQHEALIPIFPEDLTETAYKQRLFLTQFFGGPSLYLQEIGHPMLKRRHLPFEINFE